MDGINLPEACGEAGEAATSVCLTGMGRPPVSRFTNFSPSFPAPSMKEVYRCSSIGKMRMSEFVAPVKNPAGYFHISHQKSKNPLRHDRQAALLESRRLLYGEMGVAEIAASEFFPVVIMRIKS